MQTVQSPPTPQTPTVTICPTVVPQGDGSYLIKAGKPVSRLSAPEVAAFFGVDRDTIYRWRQEGIIPSEFVLPGGVRKLYFRAEVVAVLGAYFMACKEVIQYAPWFQKSGAGKVQLIETVNGYVIAKPAVGKPILIDCGTWERDWKPVAKGK